MILRNKITRTAAFLLSCVLIGICTFRGTVIIDEAVDYRENNDTGFVAAEVSGQIQELYGQLWMIGAMYLRNLDDKGSFIGSKELEQQTVAVLKEKGLMNEKGELTPKIPENFEFSVDWDGNSFSNTDRTHDSDPNADYFLRKNDRIDYSYPSYSGVSLRDYNWYETDYGMTYYDVYGEGVALFDFDTTGLKHYNDINGAVIYYKTDGSTPMPGDPDISEISDYTSFHGNHYDPYGMKEPYHVTDGDYYLVEDIPYDLKSGYYYFDEETGQFRLIKTDDFTYSLGSEKELTITIFPDSALIDEYYQRISDMQEHSKKVVRDLIDLTPFAAAALILAVFVLITGGYSAKERKYVLGSLDRIFTELPILTAILTVIAVCCLVNPYVIGDVSDLFTSLYKTDNTYVFYAIVCAMLFGIFILCLDTLIIRLKCRSFWKTSLIGHIIGGLFRDLRKIRIQLAEKGLNKDNIRNNKMSRRFLLRTGLFALAAIISPLAIFFMLCLLSIIFIGNVHGDEIITISIFPAIFIWTLIIIGYVVLGLIDRYDMNRLCRHISDISGGNYSPHKEPVTSLIYVPTEKLNNISDGIQVSVERQVKAERMKIDLVTNVSHDLKTPLTSIISYVDLLKTEELPPAARDYVDILDKKSQRLKAMVSDLFDLAKATSRTDINTEKIDAVTLTEQVLADLSDKAASYGREIRRDIQAETAPVLADGKKMYRVFQNVLDNALKYSMEGTRIYASLRNENGNCIISIKNIASYEMNFDPAEITERFTRGDESRSTEGNGLGLSIAKSFTEACGGAFGVSIDGDVFTAIITLPITSE